MHASPEILLAPSNWDSRKLRDKTRTFVEILRQIEDETRVRKALFVKVVLDIYKQYSYLKTKLFELYYWGIGQSRSVEGRRSALEQQLDALNLEKRNQQVLCWQDVAQLRRELRTWFKQYRDLVQRVRIISGSQETHGSTTTHKRVALNPLHRP